MRIVLKRRDYMKNRIHLEGKEGESHIKRKEVRHTQQKSMNTFTSITALRSQRG